VVDPLIDPTHEAHLPVVESETTYWFLRKIKHSIDSKS
jgi:hypothetical protein